MRWLRCMLSREFEIDTTLLLWDYVLGGVFLQHTSLHQQDYGIPIKESASRMVEAFPK